MPQPTNQIYEARCRELIDHPEMLSYYAKEKCKQCLGRGCIDRDFPHRGQWKELCGCVKKSIAAEVRIVGDVSKVENWKVS